MANTNILIKRSTTTGVPVSLQAGELAYSYLSNTIFIGTPDGNGVVNVGGQYYTSQIDSATDAATGSTLVRRDATGNASFNYVFANVIGTIEGNANSATQLQTARNFSIDGTDITAAAVSFNGTGDVVLNASLDTVPGLSAGTYGSNTAIPVVTVGANGRVLAISTSSIDTSFGVAADVGTADTFNTGETLTFTGGEGLFSTVDAGNNTVRFDVDNTVVRSNTPITIQTIDGSVEISGNLTVLGTQFITNTTTLNIADPLIYLAANNYYSDDVDIGFAGNYFDGANNRHTGVFRNAGNKEYYIFDNYEPEISGNNDINVADASFRVANLHANLKSQYSEVTSLQTTTISSSTGTVTVAGNLDVTGDIVIDDLQVDVITANTLTLSNALTVPNGGTGQTSFTSGQIIIGSGVNGLTQIANSSVAAGQTYGSASSVAAFETDVYGRVVAVSNTSIAIDTSQITSGTLGYARGGTGSTSYTTGGLLIAGPTGFESLANTVYTLTGALASNNTITSLTVDAYGRVTAATGSAISGLTVGQGGTGLSTITQNGITYGNGTGALGVTAAAGVADQTWSNQILTTTNAGVPVWTTALDGGQF
jgi:hypothetical protein